MAAEPVLGMPEVRPTLLDDLPITARRRSSRGSPRDEARRRVISPRPVMNTSSNLSDEDDEVIEDEEFDEDAELDEDDDDNDVDDEEEEETWQVVAS
jgi:hypothetical protein